uniref:DUF4373 domain-containing protein n=1 Tax=Strongyloides papillosus TaxID=174720 RepID=A0A0N5BXV0_STREA
MDRTQLGCRIGWEDLVIFMILEGSIYFTIILLLRGVWQNAGAAVCLNDYGQLIQSGKGYRLSVGKTLHLAEKLHNENVRNSLQSVTEKYKNPNDPESYGRKK